MECCYQPILGDEDFCAFGIPCGENEGDCDAHYECQDGLGCASCPANLGFSSNIHCCTQRGVDNGGWNFCTSSDPCGIDEGDCNYYWECKEGLLCGTDNCPTSFGFSSSVNCCYRAPLGHESFCTSEIPCNENEGNCDSHNECQEDLFCGSNNCLASLNFDSEVDCCVNCTTACNGDIGFCNCNTCSENEGDCDANDECHDGLFCGSNNCISTLGFDSEMDCCSSTQIMSQNYPHSYPKNAYETWLLTAPNGSYIKLQFHLFHVRNITLGPRLT